MAGDDPKTDLDARYDVAIDVTAVLGTSLTPISQILKLRRGAVVELNRGVGEDIEIFGNGRLVGHGEVVVVEDTLAVSVTDIIKSNIDCELSVAGTYCWKTVSSLQVTLHGT